MRQRRLESSEESEDSEVLCQSVGSEKSSSFIIDAPRSEYD